MRENDYGLKCEENEKASDWGEKIQFDRPKDIHCIALDVK